MTDRQHSRACAGIAAALAVLAACADAPPEPQDLPTVDVPPAIEVDTSEDLQAGASEPQLVGILPGDFPSDLPLYLPASLVDFGEAGNGRLTVSLLTPHGPSRVRRELFAALRDKGWSTAAGNDGVVALRKGSRRAWLHLEDARPGTRYRFEYLR